LRGKTFEGRSDIVNLKRNQNGRVRYTDSR